MIKAVEKPLPEKFKYLEQFQLGVAYSRLVHANITDAAKKEASNARYVDMQKLIHVAVRKMPDFRQALQHLETASQLREDFAPAYATRAYLHNLAGEWQELLDASDELVKLVPLCSEAYAYRGKSYQELKLYGLASKDFRKALHLNEVNPERHYELGEFHFSLKDYAGAIRHYLKAVDADADEVKDDLYYSNICTCYRLLGEFDKAIGYAKLALEAGMPQQWYDNQMAAIRREER